MLTVVMPAHNEEGYLEPAVKSVVASLRDRDGDFEVVVVENGSVDRTGEEAESLAETYSEVRVLRRTEADYGMALRAGFLEARGDLIINFDVDLVDMRFLDRAMEIMADDSVAGVIGSKRGPGAEDNRHLTRKAVTAVFSLTLRYGFGLGVSDTHGLKALRRLPLVPLVERCRFGTDIFDTELILRAERAGLKLREVPVTVSEQRPPRTPIAGRIPRSVVGLARLRWVLMREVVTNRQNR